MRVLRASALAAALVGAGLLAGGLSAADEAALARGEAVAQIIPEAGPGGRIEAAIDIAAPIEAVWAVMLDCAGAPAFVPGLKACQVLETAPDGLSDLREQKVSWLAILPRLTLRFRSTYDLRPGRREIAFAKEGGDLAEMAGTWLLEAQPAGTRLTYRVRMVPSRLAPAGLVRAGLQRDTPKVLEAVRDETLRRQAAR